MSLYNMVHGSNPLAGPLLDSLKLYPPSTTIDRFRDAALYNKDREENDYLIRIITRTSGPNRETHQRSIDRLTQNEYFLSEEDDTYDHTYMYFFFRLPESLVADLREVEESYPGRLHKWVDNKTIKEKTDFAMTNLPEG